MEPDRLPDAVRIAAAINLRVRQLEAQGITGRALVNHTVGHMQDLQRIHGTTSDQGLLDLCCRFPGFERYARLREEMSEQNQAMATAGTHPYGDLPELPERSKASMTSLMRGAVELERAFQAAVDADRADQAERLTVMRRQWADDLQKLVGAFHSSDVPLRTQALVQQGIKAMAERIGRMARDWKVRGPSGAET